MDALALFRRIALWLAAAACLCLSSATALGYTLEGPQWAANKPITINLQLGPSTVPLLDGSASWGASAEDALNQWGAVLGDVRFTVVRDSTVPIAQGDGVSSVFFSNTAFGTAFGSGVLALTFYAYKIPPSGSGQIMTEADVVFNNTEPFDSYRGPVHNIIGSLFYDFHRVALHEFGHLLGLGHTAQTDAAIMTPVTTNLDALQADDIAGVQSMYGAPTGVTPTPVPAVTPPPSGASPTPTPTPVPTPTPTPIPALPTVAVIPLSPTADWSTGMPGRLTITRGGDNALQDLVVPYTVKGSAVPGVDYAPLSGTRKIKAGKTSATVIITPLRQTGGRKLTLMISPSSQYQVGVAKAKVKLQ